MVLLSINKRIEKSDLYRHICFSFNVNSIYNTLVFNFNYLPSILEDKDKSISIIKDCFQKYLGEIPEERIKNHLPIKNLLTLSISSPMKSLGTAHRHKARQTIFINNENASRGFHTSKIIKGEWNVVISIHSIVTDYVDMNLVVEGIND